MNDTNYFKGLLFCIGLILLGTSGAIFVGLTVVQKMSLDVKEVVALLKEQTELMRETAATKSPDMPSGRLAVYPVCRVQRTMDVNPWEASMDQLIMAVPLYLDSQHWCDQAKGLPNYVVLYY